jgi:hypothetical protein
MRFQVGQRLLSGSKVACHTHRNTYGFARRTQQHGQPLVIQMDNARARPGIAQLLHQDWSFMVS